MSQSSPMGFGAIGVARASSDGELRENACKKVRAEAQRGKSPAAVFPADDLAWAFKGREDELAALEVHAAEVVERQSERANEKRETRRIERMIETVEREWDAAEKASRRRRAEAEARRRLGIAEEDA